VNLEPKTIRFYERVGLLQPRRHGRFRIYAQGDVDLLLAIKQFRAFGMSLKSIRELLVQLQGEAKREALTPELRKILLRQLTALEAKLRATEQGIAQITSLLGSQPPSVSAA
jgi:DNA-binding transcriptional MerR regulator